MATSEALPKGTFGITCEICGEEIRFVEDVRFEGDTLNYGYIHARCGSSTSRGDRRLGLLLCVASGVWTLVLVVAILRWILGAYGAPL